MQLFGLDKLWGRLSRHPIMVIFFLHAFAGGAIFPRIPDLQLSLGLNEAALGLVLMGQPVGGFGAIVFSSFFIERLGPKRILLVAISMIPVSIFLAALAPNSQTLFAAMFLYGISFAAANMAMNVEADRVEAHSERRVMNLCHGVWSAGYLLASVLGVVARGIGMSPAWHFGLILVPTVALAIFIIAPMPVMPPRAHAGTSKKKMFALPSGPTMLLVGVLLAEVLTGGAVRAWSVIFMRDSFSAPDWVDALTLPVFLITLTVGRLYGDRFVGRYGPVSVVKVLYLPTIAGLALVLFGTNVYLALCGFALLGLGMCVIFPLAMSAAARIGDRPASENVTAMSLATNILVLGSPGLFGFVAQAYGIRSIFYVLIPLYLVSFALSPRLAEKTEAS